MTEKVKKIIKEEIDKAAQEIGDSLPQHWKHPKGRNPYAHIPKVIKSIYGKPYSDLDDDELENILEIIKFCKENPF